MNAFSQQNIWINKKIDIFYGLFPYIILSSTSFVVYILTICPTIYWRDSSEFINVGFNLGIAHPSGSPAYSLISKIITFIPVGSIAFKINFISLLFAVGSVTILFKLILYLTELCFGKPEEKLSRIAALITSFLVIFSPSFWMNAVVAEVYTMNIFLLCLIIYLSIRWSKTEQKHFILLAAFLYGLSTGVHGGMSIFFPIFILFFLIVELQKSEKVPSTSLIVSLFFLIGFSVFLFLPIRSITNPTFDWGNPETFFRFVNHVSDMKDSSTFFSDTDRAFSLTKNTGLFWKMFSNEYTPLGILLGIIGFFTHVRKNKTSFFLCTALFLMNIFFYLSTTYKSFANSILFLPSLIIFSFWIGTGIFAIVKCLAHFLYKYYLKRLIFILLSGLIMFSFLKNYNEMNKSLYYLAENITKTMYLSMKPNAISFSNVSWFPFRFFKDVENLRPDVTILSVSDLEEPSIFNPVKPERFPDIKFPFFESDSTNFENFTATLIKLNIDNKYIYTDFDKALNRLKGFEILPHKSFIATIYQQRKKDKKEVIDKYLLALESKFQAVIDNVNLIFDQNVGAKDALAMYLINISDYLILQKRFKDAEKQLKLASYFIQDNYRDKNIMNMLGVCFIHQNRLKEAETLYQSLLTSYPDDFWYLYSLGIVNMNMGKMDKAKMYLEKSIALKSNYAEALSALKRVNQQLQN